MVKSSHRNYHETHYTCDNGMVCNVLQKIFRFEHVETLNPQHLAVACYSASFFLHNVTCPHKRKLLFSMFFTSDCIGEKS